MGIIAESRVKVKVGMRFGKLTVIGRAFCINHKSFAVCECDCLCVIAARTDTLLDARTRCCGCSTKKVATKKKHGAYCRGQRQRLYMVWQSMRQRCRNPKATFFYRYGGRGIEVCDEWNDYSAFRDWAIASGYADHLTIDRIDNDGNYEPSNCRWATMLEQARNKSPGKKSPKT